MEIAHGQRGRFLLAVLSLMFGLFCHLYENYYEYDAELKAKRLSQRLMLYNFDAIEVDTSSLAIMFYKHAPISNSSSLLSYELIAMIYEEPSVIDDFQTFRNIRRIGEGLLFATHINWDGEWSGIFITCEEIPDNLENYVTQGEDGVYWLCEVPC